MDNPEPEPTSEFEHEHEPEPERTPFWHRRRPGYRFVLSAAAVIGGTVLAVRSVGRVGESTESTWVFVGALVLVVLGLVSIPVYLWMGRRGH
ncbi:hypothetical protein ACFSBZ_00800 [Amnibacterium flavum]|uniref:Uncharacterized protein n=1 Tax=Amnibacterium flavum TaxID=2173173 RepID=A0A2V1HMA8_9MICO|nr:hypothetical protein [Amnibacterium flavum]PVZ93541.1 hypothetical protein DDQ50_14585 [Amnibacterium flavum]